ncbi:MAG: hypothetical protein N4A61_14830 [Pelagimonas sp.]|jgi:hypothetical protein|nr:hypothetical protein [Pelagimonas sp.]
MRLAFIALAATLIIPACDYTPPGDKAIAPLKVKEKSYAQREEYISKKRYVYVDNTWYPCEGDSDAGCTVVVKREEERAHKRDSWRSKTPNRIIGQGEGDNTH